MVAATEIKRLGDPAGEPVSLETAKEQLNVDADITADDDLISGYIKSAREMVENFSNRPFVLADWGIIYPTFPPSSVPICLPFSGISEIVEISYLDSEYNEIVIDDSTYELDDIRQIIKTSAAWPTIVGSILVKIRAGADVTGSPPEEIQNAVKQSILLYIADAYENRMSQIEGSSFGENPAAENYLYPYRVALGV